ncbi:MAG: hypothetical protein ACMXX9_04250 [Candidatus Woesearchaeota archaeon]
MTANLIEIRHHLNLKNPFSKGFITGLSQEIEGKQNFNLENITKAIELAGYEFQNAYKIHFDKNINLDYSQILLTYYQSRYLGVLKKNLTQNLPEFLIINKEYKDCELDIIINDINKTKYITNLKINNHLIKKYADRTNKKYGCPTIKKAINYIKRGIS